MWFLYIYIYIFLYNSISCDFSLVISFGFRLTGPLLWCFPKSWGRSGILMFPFGAVDNPSSWFRSFGWVLLFGLPKRPFGNFFGLQQIVVFYTKSSDLWPNLKVKLRFFDDDCKHFRIGICNLDMLVLLCALMLYKPEPSKTIKTVVGICLFFQTQTKTNMFFSLRTVKTYQNISKHIKPTWFGKTKSKKTCFFSRLDATNISLQMLTINGLCRDYGVGILREVRVVVSKVGETGEFASLKISFLSSKFILILFYFLLGFGVFLVENVGHAQRGLLKFSFLGLRQILAQKSFWNGLNRSSHFDPSCRELALPPYALLSNVTYRGPQGDVCLSGPWEPILPV